MTSVSFLTCSIRMDTLASCDSKGREEKGTSVSLGGREANVWLWNPKQGASRWQSVTGGGKNFSVSFCQCLSVLFLPYALWAAAAACGFSPKKTIKVPPSKALNLDYSDKAAADCTTNNCCLPEANSNNSKKAKWISPCVSFCPRSVSLLLSVSPSLSIFHILSQSLLLSLMRSADSSGRRGEYPQPHVSADLSSCLFFTCCLPLSLRLSLPLPFKLHYVSLLFVFIVKCVRFVSEATFCCSHEAFVFQIAE